MKTNRKVLGIGAAILAAASVFTALAQCRYDPLTLPCIAAGEISCEGPVLLTIDGESVLCYIEKKALSTCPFDWYVDFGSSGELGTPTTVTCNVAATGQAYLLYNCTVFLPFQGRGPWDRDCVSIPVVDYHGTCQYGG